MTQASPGGSGRYLILLDDAIEGARSIAQLTRLSTASSAELTVVDAANMLGELHGRLFDRLGVAVVTPDEEQLDALTRAVRQHGPIAQVERERTVHAIGAATSEGRAVGQETLTWGLQAIAARQSTATGNGVRVAVLDTGFDATHPDFAGRAVTTESFVSGEGPQDGHGHGTHCIGTACGPREPESGPGYGVAHECDIYAGKVLGDDGSGDDSGILEGLTWAVDNGCTVVSMSLGAPAQAGEPHSRTFERVARRAMAQGTLVVAAAGNESDRDRDVIAPVGHPANCPSVLAVGAIDEHDRIADFSSATVDPNGAVDVVGPGVEVYSSWPMPERTNTISGTSMATPHVAGVAALYAQQHDAAGWELWARLGQAARRMDLRSTDVGSGLIQAPDPTRE